METRKKNAPTENLIQIPRVPNTECLNVAAHNSEPQTPDFHRRSLNHCGYLVRQRHNGAAFSPQNFSFPSLNFYSTRALFISVKKVFCIRPHLRMRPQRGFPSQLTRQIKINISTLIRAIFEVLNLPKSSDILKFVICLRMCLI